MASGAIVKGIDGVIKHLDEAIARADASAERIVTKGSLIIASNAKKQFNPRPGGMRVSKKTGRIYYQGAPNFPASPPNPTQRSGNLRNSIKTVSVRRLEYGRWESVTGPSEKYGEFVEKGTGRARPFPYMAPGRDKSQDAISTMAEQEWTR